MLTEDQIRQLEEHEWQVISTSPFIAKRALTPGEQHLTSEESAIHMLDLYKFGKNKPKDPERIAPILQLLQDYWIKNPELRLGQLLVGLNPKPSGDIFYLNDAVLENQLKERLTKDEEARRLALGKGKA